MELVSLSNLLKDKVNKSGLNYEKFARDLTISKTYLTEIINQGRIPSLKIIEKIGRKLNINLNSIREYKLMKLLDGIEDTYNYYDDLEFEKILNVINSKSKYVREIKSKKVWQRSLRDMQKTDWLDLKDFPKEVKDSIVNTYNQFYLLLKNKQV